MWRNVERPGGGDDIFIEYKGEGLRSEGVLPIPNERDRFPPHNKVLSTRETGVHQRVLSKL